ncbi:reverse transcriptase-like protein [Cytobacillus oceanisediminis]|uniref:reverse transcriptase-like protein n=1 Tax=Cytobacillus oceanisediminis TaxID=665099 RepID=UPI001FB25B4F|nr:reverse transcriptase-like protein [Cytobacillus oceanisediminis]UOE58134.1 reverse transcriptase-like protein [Cytobacillus oceanisediminis]
MNKKTKQMVRYARHLFFLWDELKNGSQLEKAAETKIQFEIALKELRSNGYDVKELLEGLKLDLHYHSEFGSIVIFTDGALRHSHKLGVRSACSFAVYGNGKLLDLQGTIMGDSILHVSGKILPADSMLAEYHGMLQAVKYVDKHNIKSNSFIFLSDCFSMVDLLTGQKLHHRKIFLQYGEEIKKYTDRLSSVEFKHIPRAYNKIADQHVNKLLDSYERGELLCN